MDLDGSDASDTPGLRLEGRNYQIEPELPVRSVGRERGQALRCPLTPLSTPLARWVGVDPVVAVARSFDLLRGEAVSLRPRGDPRDPRVGASERARGE